MWYLLFKRFLVAWSLLQFFLRTSGKPDCLGSVHSLSTRRRAKILVFSYSFDIRSIEHWLDSLPAMNELIWASGFFVAACASCSSFCLPWFILCIWATNGAIILYVIVAAGHRVSCVFFVLFVVVGAVYELNPVLDSPLPSFFLVVGRFLCFPFLFFPCATMVFRCGYY